MKAYLFPGQGSQIKGMGASLFDQFPDLIEKADRILGYSIKTLCLEDPNNVLNKTQFTQPALYIVNALAYLQQLEKDPSQPHYVAGHSLGEYNALFAANIIDFETGLRLVCKRGELMSKVSNGGMAAVLKCDLPKIKSILLDNKLTTIDIANYNSPDQVVLSGPKSDLENAQSLFLQAGTIFIPLNVSAAFHSRYMQQVANEFRDFIFLEEFSFSSPSIPVIANLNALPYSINETKQNLVKQINHPVLWTDSIRYMITQGVTIFQEIGPSEVLTKLVKSIQEHTPISISIPLPAINHSNSTIFTADNLGSSEFRKCYNLRYAYLAGSMVKGISSKELIICMGKAGLMGYYGTGGLKLNQIEDAILAIKNALPKNKAYGMNLLSNIINPAVEMNTVNLFIRHEVTHVEAAAYIQLNAAIVKYRITGLSQNVEGETVIKHKLLAKISRPEVADLFCRPPPQAIVQQLLTNEEITPLQANLSKTIPMADDLCVESDSGGHTDMGVMIVILPTIIRQCEAACRLHQYKNKIRVGASGGIGTPEAAAAAFILGADFIMTGSINQCTIEAGISDSVKDMLAELNIQDTDYAPAGDMFEIGAKIQVMRKGVFFPGRANKLYELWCNYSSWEDIPLTQREQIEKHYFHRSFIDVYQETKAYYMQTLPQEIEKAERNPKHKLALVFRWYFIYTARLARNGDKTDKVNYQIHTGPAMGAFNQWVKGTDLENWRNRRPDIIAEKLMQATADLLNQRYSILLDPK